VSTLRRRLANVEARLRPPRAVEMRGAYEEHYTKAWPDCQQYPENKAVHCEDPEHGPACAVVVTPISAPIRRIIVMTGATAAACLGIG
jgi:hypothetical protein